MKKTIIVVLLILSLPIALFAISYQSLYTLDVPYTFQNLYVSGSLGGNDALNITIDTSPTVTFAANAGLDGNYYFINHTEDAELELSSAGTYAELGSTGIFLNALATGDYKNYGFTLSSYPAYYEGSGTARVFLSLPFGGAGATFIFDLRPNVGVGIGKMNDISTIKRIINIANHYGITPTSELVENVAKIEYERVAKLNAYSNDESELWIAYRKELAHAYTLDDKVLDLIYVGASQEYVFEQARWTNLKYGWSAYAQMRPTFFFETGTTSTFRFTLGLALGGQYATLLSDETIYLGVDGEIVPTIDSLGTPFFKFLANVGLDARYFFANPRMWAASTVDIAIDTSAVTTFDFDVTATFNYLVAPNFTTYGGVEILNTFDRLSILAGGEIRLF